MLQIEVSVFGGDYKLTEYDSNNKETVIVSGTLDQCKAALANEIASRSKDVIYSWDTARGVIDQKSMNKDITTADDWVRLHSGE